MNSTYIVVGIGRFSTLYYFDRNGHFSPILLANHFRGSRPRIWKTWKGAERFIVREKAAGTAWNLAVLEVWL